ncbi:MULTISPECIES: ScbR family autoregulator-binding transcription factor [unclassified Streptomyces]|uniref:ScbR family autoregulator-binding transcription factor n=1 Tax=unclassified Streptomyces TaxID=2593676 RepID=UPI00085CAF1A|nr:MULTISPECIES: ScbR family autoregulator-binding transcription factor [unclassified Streptomyces]QLJ02216.1 TetR family transcriptional regulator [Streptomyces sp. NEAU-sy36]SFY48136.1 A-factor receptor protein [Streptomyces sp. F-1]
MAQQERAVRTRRAVLEAAAAVFAERGYAAATIAEILNRAGVTKGALYFHFDSKAALARGVLQEQISTEYHVPRELKLQEWVDAGMTLADRLPREPLLLAGVRLSADLRGRNVFGSAWPAWAEFTAARLAEAKSRGEVLAHVVPEESAQVFLGAWTGVQLVSQALADWADLDERMAALFDHLLPAIAVPSVLDRLDTAPDRGARVIAEVRGRSRTALAGTRA